MIEERIIVGRYRLTSLLGRGGMGAVWRAWDETLGREVAVKEVIAPPGVADQEAAELYERAMREARSAARLSHPGVVTVHDVAEQDGRPWIVMELVHGRNLQEIIRQEGPLTPGRAAAIGRHVLAALSAAHGLGILHRDVKPGNILLTDDDQAVLTDFGIAVIAGDATITRTGAVVGSPAYVAPERVRGVKATPATDLWSLGATLYAAVEGRAPFERPDPVAVYGALLTEEPAPPHNAGPLAPVIQALLRKEPERRPTSAAAMERLAALAPGGQVRENPNPVLTRRDATATVPGPITGTHLYDGLAGALMYAIPAFMFGELIIGLGFSESESDRAGMPGLIGRVCLVLTAICQLPAVLSLYLRHRGEQPVSSQWTLGSGLAGTAALGIFATAWDDYSLGPWVLRVTWFVAWIWLVPVCILLWRRAQAVALTGLIVIVPLEVLGGVRVATDSSTLVGILFGLVLLFGYGSWAIMIGIYLRIESDA